MAKIVNSTPNGSVKIPQTKYMIKKSMQPNLKYEVYKKCNSCLNYILSLENQNQCALCDAAITTTQSDYLQLLQSIQRYIIENILSYYSAAGEENNLTDLHNSRIFQKIKIKYPDTIILPMIVNTDGVKVFHSNRDSLWMIQVIQGWLPPSIRYYPSNVFIVASHFGAKKPSMPDFFFPFLVEIRQINESGGISFSHNGRTYNFMPLIFR